MDKLNVRIKVENKADPKDIKLIKDGLEKHNIQFTTPDNHQELSVFLRDEKGEIRGGILAGTYWDWLHIDIFWIDESMRGGGHGTEMLKAAEKEAIKRGCGNAHLDTHDFQALGFYQKNGYEICGQLDDLPKGYNKYLLKKKLQ